jgi:hypothetical protein
VKPSFANQCRSLCRHGVKMSMGPVGKFSVFPVLWNPFADLCFSVVPLCVLRARLQGKINVVRIVATGVTCKK